MARAWCCHSWLWLLCAQPSAWAHGDEPHEPPAAVANTGASASVTRPSDLPSTAQRMPDGSLWVPKAVQHRLGLRTVMTHSAALSQATELNGRVLADPAASGKVQASQPGQIEPAASGWPRPGQQVKQGQQLAWLRPVGSSLERGSQQATLAELDGQLALAERQVARAEALDGILPRKDLEAARLTRDTLRQRRNAIAASLDERVALRAPISGVIASVPVSPGQVVDAKDLLLEVLDPQRWVVEALAYDAAVAQHVSGASATLPGGGSLPLQFLGASPQWRDQALPLLFKARPTPPGQAPAAVAVGQLLKVTVRSTATVKGMAVPRAALSRSPGGETQVWVHTAPEQFAPRIVRTQPLDALNVAVVAGLHEHDRVVVSGASLLAQVR